MAYLSFEQVTATSSVKDSSDLTIPVKATHAELQASGNNVAYTMDGSTDPTVSSGMTLVTTNAPKLFLIEDIRNIRFIRFGGSDGNLNIHYLAGRDV